MSSKVCAQCQAAIDGKFLQVGGKDYLHPACFKCAKCGDSLAAGKPATRKEGQFVCADCVESPTCHRCKAAIKLGEKSTKVGDLTFHETCLTCAQTGCRVAIPKDRLFLSTKNVTRDIYCANHTYV